MIRFIGIFMMASLLLGPGDGKKKGRKGNAQYTQEQYKEASASYLEGIQSVQEGGPGAVHSGLLNNLGASLFRGGDAEQAHTAFSTAARMANAPEDLVRASYNAGNAAYTTEKLEDALENYRRALLNDPSNADAKFNYEFVKRQMQKQEQDQQHEDDQSQDQNQENQDDQQGDDNQESDNQNQEQNQEQQQNEQYSEDQNQEQDPQKRQQEREDPTKLSKEEAERILQALENEEQQLLRQVQKMKTRPRRVEKDW